ncbi:MAG: lipid IV(A) 3-deoxy-D-manno-octulosonic acid transferase [Pseudomonadota bacterium]
MKLLRFGYTLLLYLLLPYAVFHLLWRGRRQPGYLRHIGERFGRYGSKPDQPVIWLHAVSVGETRAAVPLVQRLRERYPGHRILITHMTPTGRETGEQLFGGSVLRCYLPYDYPFAVRRFLRHFRPEVGLLMETELWFNLVEACTERGLPLLLVNARLSEKSARRYRRFSGLTRAALGQLAAVAAQTGEDARRLEELGALSPAVMGNLKFDCSPSESMLRLGSELRARFGADRPLFLAASTREGEEELILDAVRGAQVPGLLTVIVPRHPQRFDEVARLLEQRGIPYQRRSSELAVEPQTEVVLGDSMGEMFAYYATSDVAFIGGSLLPYGGQNLIEACAVGRPVLIGPHTYNFAEASRLALQAGAALRVANGEALAAALNRLFRDEAAREAMSKAGLAFSRDHRGATERVMSLIEGFIRE